MQIYTTDILFQDTICNGHLFGGQDSIVALATPYRLDGPAVESQWGQDFQHQTSPGAHPASYTRGTGSLS